MFLGSRVLGLGLDASVRPVDLNDYRAFYCLLPLGYSTQVLGGGGSEGFDTQGVVRFQSPSSPQTPKPSSPKVLKLKLLSTHFPCSYPDMPGNFIQLVTAPVSSPFSPTPKNLVNPNKRL